MSFFLSQKFYHYIALLLFSVVMTCVLMVFPAPVLTGPVGDPVGLMATLLTASAGSPFFLGAVFLLCLLPVLMKQPGKVILRVWIQFAILLVLSFAAKTGLKHLTEEPRPYTYQLQQLQLVDTPEVFYRLDDTGKQHVVAAASEYVSTWRLQHWQGETNYSLPSGHTIFVAACVLFWGGFLLRRRKYISTVILMTWATGVAFSRIWLGMHWPADLIASIACAGVLYLLVPEALPRQQKPCDRTTGVYALR